MKVRWAPPTQTDGRLIGRVEYRCALWWLLNRMDRSTLSHHGEKEWLLGRGT